MSSQDQNLAPIILIGAARSGTKFLRDAIAKDEAFSVVPFDVNYVWRMGNESLAHDRLDPASITEGQAEKIRRELWRLALKAPGPRRLLEKTVSNSLRVPFVDRIFPSARYIHLVRDGRAVVESSARMWKSPPDHEGIMKKLKRMRPAQAAYVRWFAVNYLKGLIQGRSGGAIWGPRYPGILDDLATVELNRVIARQWKYSVQHAADDLRKIPAERVFEIRFEDLACDAEKALALARFTGAQSPDSLAQSVLAGFDPGNLDKWRANLTDSEVAAIVDEAYPELSRYGYAG